MNTKIFRQYDGPWAKKPYPTARCTVSGAGCGLVALTHIAIEQDSKKNWTPENLRPYMLKNGYALAGQGTRWEGITNTLKYIGHKNVVRIYNDPMSEAWKELNKGNRIGIILFSAGKGGSSRVTWTTCGHYVAFTDYKVQNGKHWFYTKDSGGRKHDGWYSYEGAMKGRVAKLWIVERLKTSLNSRLMTACVEQSVWMKNAAYKWESKPTIAKSKYKGTCVTYVACVLQRIGYLKPGEFIWQNGKGYGTGKVYGTNNKMTVTYMGNKTLKSLRSQLRSGDIILLDDNRSGNQGGGGHIFILEGRWTNAGDPYVWDNETAKKQRKSRPYNGNRKVLAIVRLK